MIRSLLVTTALFSLLSPAAFGATLVSSGGDEPTVDFKAAKGERNRVSVHVARGKALVRDRAQRLRLRGGLCVRVSPKSARCPADLIDVNLGDGDDELKVSAESSEMFSTASVEDVDGGHGADRILLGYGGIANGGPGDDLLDSDADPFARSAYLDGGRGSDRVTGASGADDLTGGLGDDVVRGRRGRDRVGGGGEGRDRLYGGAGPDRLDDQDFYAVARGRDSDKLAGGPGRDIVESYRFRVRPLFINLSRPGGDGQRGEDDSLSRIENVWSGYGDDVLVGNDIGNKIIGGEGDDLVRGGGGNDTLDATEGDRVRAGSGDDNIRTLPAAEASVSCDAGADRVTSRLRRPRLQGPLLGGDCERIERRASGPPREPLAFDPVPAGIDGDGNMTFTVFEFTCCDETLQLTRPAPPFELLDSAPIDASEITVTATADVLRAKAGTISDPLVWRFRVGGEGG